MSHSIRGYVSSLRPEIDNPSSSVFSKQSQIPSVFLVKGGPANRLRYDSVYLDLARLKAPSRVKGLLIHTHNLKPGERPVTRLFFFISIGETAI